LRSKFLTPTRLEDAKDEGYRVNIHAFNKDAVLLLFAQCFASVFAVAVASGPSLIRIDSRAAAS
jgi:hypothetical protein